MGALDDIKAEAGPLAIESLRYVMHGEAQQSSHVRQHIPRLMTLKLVELRDGIYYRTPLGDEVLK